MNLFSEYYMVQWVDQWPPGDHTNHKNMWLPLDIWFKAYMQNFSFLVAEKEILANLALFSECYTLYWSFGNSPCPSNQNEHIPTIWNSISGFCSNFKWQIALELLTAISPPIYLIFQPYFTLGGLYNPTKSWLELCNF